MTKGSFYWHFKDRPDLLDAVLEEWEATDTRLIRRGGGTGHPGGTDVPLRGADHGIGEEPDQAAVESAVLAWAQVDPVVAERVARVEATHVRNTERLLLDLGFPPDGAGEVGRSGLHDLRGDDEPRETRCEVSAAAELGVSRSAARSGSASGGCSTQAAGGSLTVVVSSPVVWPPPTSIGTCVVGRRRRACSPSLGSERRPRPITTTAPKAITMAATSIVVLNPSTKEFRATVTMVSPVGPSRSAASPTSVARVGTTSSGRTAST